MKTYSAKASDIKREWHVIDASGKILGKVATEAANLLMGKHKPMYTRNMDTGDFVVIINAGKVEVTGKKTLQKLYYRHSGYPNGLKSDSLEKVMATNPPEAIERSVKGMLPYNKLRASMMKRLRVFTGAEHPYAAQTNPSLKGAEN